MSRMGDALISCWEAGAVPVELDEVRGWRAAGHDVPVTFVPVTNWQGRQVPMPAVALDVADRLARSLDDETTRETLAAAVADARDFRVMIGKERPRRPAPAVTAARLAGEIIAAVAAGDELPEEWFRLDAYADVGEPIAWEVCRLVREELQGTAIRV